MLQPGTSAAAILILVALVALGWYFARRALQPFEEITRTAEKINYENLNTQIISTHKEQEVQRLVQSFNAMVSRLSKSFSQMRKFNADVAHELRTPLTAIRGYAETLLDGARVVSASADQTLKLWDAATGKCLATLPLFGEGLAAAYSPVRGSVTCGATSGSVYLADVVGIPMGPLPVTAVDLGNGPVVRCPVCEERSPLREAWLGREMICPRSVCQTRLRVNPFVVRLPPALP